MWTGAGPRSRNLRRVGSWLCAGLALAGAAHARALSTDNDQPIAIEADRAERNDLKRTTIYRTDVVIDQGSLHITGDTVTAHFGKENEVLKMVALGSPAHFRQLPDGDASYRKAWAKRIEYFPEQNLIVLFGEARYEKGENRIQADRLVYDSFNARFKALTDDAGAPAHGGGEAAGKKPGRVRITIGGRKDGTQ